MITQLGNDAFGDLIIDTLKDVGVSTEYIVRKILYPFIVYIPIS